MKGGLDDELMQENIYSVGQKGSYGFPFCNLTFLGYNTKLKIFSKKKATLI
jgi:hypothetical protein